MKIVLTVIGILASLTFVYAKGSTVSVIDFVSEGESANAPGVPFFVNEPLYPSGQSSVFGFVEAGDQDIVLMDNGFDRGFRVGMICQLLRQEAIVGEMILVEVRRDRAAGLITQLFDAVIQINDTIKIKTTRL